MLSTLQNTTNIGAVHFNTIINYVLRISVAPRPNLPHGTSSGWCLRDGRIIVRVESETHPLSNLTWSGCLPQYIEKHLSVIDKFYFDKDTRHLFQVAISSDNDRIILEGGSIALIDLHMDEGFKYIFIDHIDNVMVDFVEVSEEQASLHRLYISNI